MLDNFFIEWKAVLLFYFFVLLIISIIYYKADKSEVETTWGKIAKVLDKVSTTLIAYFLITLWIEAIILGYMLINLLK
ncbi:hypothetical protein [Lactobacillus jensenii]|uniref:Bacteriocin immunity protein n=1 Tax=Lactobacillus jensenii TaxID=109790 RepID=A0ABU9FJI1_LACJE|nr:hypothetical protein [Lactobacillus jensenii]MDT9545009.1 hypothetical protein [Lactobacillus jensenii]